VTRNRRTTDRRPGESFDSFAGQQQYAGFDLAEMALFDDRQGGQWFSA
jgi:hypothetical protein